MAEGIMQHLANERDLDWEIDSAGTSSWHAGEMPDDRAVAECAKRGLDISNQRSRQITHDDFNRFDIILTMDRENYRQVASMIRNEKHKAKLFPITDFSNDRTITAIPDPYFDGSFESVGNLLEEVCAAVLDHYSISSAEK